MERLRKSSMNMVVAKELIDVSSYAPSIHISYYSAFLTMKYVCNTFLNIPYEQQDDPENAITSHINVFEAIDNSLSNLSYNDKRDFNNKLILIRRNRKKADYSTNPMNESYAKLTLTTAAELNNLLRSIYNITL